jgi:hypothetical protein
MAALTFDARTVAPDTGSADALPAGWYNVMMDESEMKPTKADASGNTGAYLKCRYAVMDGQYAGRKIYANLNLRNANPIAQEIAYKQLSAICHAVNVLNMQDTQELHGKPLKIKVKMRKATDEYEASNDIGAYKNINDTSVGASAAAGASAPPAGFGAPAGMPAGFAPAQNFPAPQQPPQQQFQAPQQQFQAPPQQFAPPAQQQQQQQFQQPQQAPAGGAPQWQAPAAAQPWDGQQQPQQQPQAQPQQQQFQPQQQAPQQQFQQPAPQQQFAPQQQQAPAQQPQNFGAAVPPWQQPQQ